MSDDMATTIYELPSGRLATRLTTVARSAQPIGDFRWAGSLAPGRTIEIKNVNGSIRAELATGNQAEVLATKRSRRSKPWSRAPVRLVTTTTSSDGRSTRWCG